MTGSYRAGTVLATPVPVRSALPRAEGDRRSVGAVAAGVVAALGALHLATGLQGLVSGEEGAEARMRRAVRIAVHPGLLEADDRDGEGRRRTLDDHQVLGRVARSDQDERLVGVHGDGSPL